MSFPSRVFSFLAGVFCICLLSGTGQAQSMVSVSSGTGQNSATVVHQKKQQSNLESTAKTMGKGTVLQSPAETPRSSQRFLQEFPQPPAKGTEKVTADPFAAVLNYAWQEYRLENYTQAKELFLQAGNSVNAENRRNAEYGLLYSYLKLGDTNAALPLLQEFVARGEQLESTAPPLAAILFELGDFEAVQALLPKLSPLQQKEWQERVLREQLHLMSNNDLLVAASTPSEGKMSDVSRNRLLREALWQRLEQLDQKDFEYDSFVQALYRQDPNNSEAASMAAWACYQRGEYGCAGDIFSTLVQNDPTDDALLGLIYTLQKQGELRAVLALLAQHSDRESTIFEELRHDLHATLGGTLYQNKNYREASAHLEQALRDQPEDRELTKMLLWSRYHLGETSPLVEFLWQQYRENGSVDSAESLSDLLEGLKSPVFTQKVMARFAESDTAEVRKIAGDYAFQQKHPVLADQIYQGQSPYDGSAAPALDTMFHVRSKGGDNGTSSLRAATLIVRQKVSTQYGKTWSVALFPLSMSSGSLPEDIPVGSVFRSPDQSQVQPELWEEDVLAWGWRSALQIEGNLDWDIELGTTPVNGVVSPALIGKVEGRGSDWGIAVARDSVRDSMLSWLGQSDPYGGGEWGRVVQTSLAGTKTLSFSDWWLAFEGRFGWYRGESVEQNSSLTASISGGYTAQWTEFERSTGLFLFARGFRRNSNFYTYGHGGYYSPAQQIIAGPFFRLVTLAATDYWLEASCSAGLNYRKTDDAPRYAELGTINIGPGDPGWQELIGEYGGESETGLGLDAQVRGLLPLASGWFIGGEASINNVADFTQWQLAVALRYRFGEGMGLGLPERDFSMLTRLVQ